MNAMSSLCLGIGMMELWGVLCEGSVVKCGSLINLPTLPCIAREPRECRSTCGNVGENSLIWTPTQLDFICSSARGRFFFRISGAEAFRGACDQVGGR